jgi:hypothetical protein
MAYEMNGGDHGNYTIFPAGKTAHSAVAHLRRNQAGGGYTLKAKDGREVQIFHMPTYDQANALMKTLEKEGK